jgi:hypothetical protein
MISPEDSFCQDCGFALEHYRIDSFIDDEYCSEGERQTKKTWFTVALSPTHAKPAVRLSLIVSVLLLLLLTPFGVIAISNSYDSVSERYIVQHAQKALEQNNPHEAVETLGRLYLWRGNSLHKETVDLYGKALLARSESYLKQHLTLLAMKDLQAVPADCSLSSVAVIKLKALSPQPTGSAIRETRAKPMMSDKRQRTTFPLNSVGAKKGTASIVTEAHTLSSSSPTQSEIGSSHLSDAINSANFSSAIKEDKGRRSKGIVHSSTTKFEANDIAKYNELLAGYFSHVHQPQKATNALEPPSFKEWMDSGKPDFD